MSFSSAGCMRKMCNDEIRDMFDSNPNMTVATLARLAGKTTEQIKRILMENN